MIQEHQRKGIREYAGVDRLRAGLTVVTSLLLNMDLNKIQGGIIYVAEFSKSVIVIPLDSKHYIWYGQVAKCIIL